MAISVSGEVHQFLSQAGRIGGLTKSARHDPVEGTAAARAASPGSDAYWLKQVDPERVLPEGERARRAEAAKKAHFARLAFKSAQARRRS